MFIIIHWLLNGFEWSQHSVAHVTWIQDELFFDRLAQHRDALLSGSYVHWFVFITFNKLVVLLFEFVLCCDFVLHITTVCLELLRGSQANIM